MINDPMFHRRLIEEHQRRVETTIWRHHPLQHTERRRLRQSPGLECMMPPSAKIVVAVR